MKTTLVFFAFVLYSSSAHADSPWNGTWKLDVSRSSPDAKSLGAAEGYTFDIQPDGRLRWEIPSLQEVVTGTITGQPMTIHSPSAPPGLTLSVRAEGAYVLCYQVARQGRVLGEGRMTLVDGSKAWVDLVWSAGKPETARELVYVKAKN